MFAPTEAVRFLDDAHRNRDRYQNIPEAMAPATVAEAYDVQEALCARWGERLGPVAGLKIATTTKVMQELLALHHPRAGIRFPPRRSSPRAHLRKLDYL